MRPPHSKLLENASGMFSSPDTDWGRWTKSPSVCPAGVRRSSSGNTREHMVAARDTIRPVVPKAQRRPDVSPTTAVDWSKERAAQGRPYRPCTRGDEFVFGCPFVSYRSLSETAAEPGEGLDPRWPLARLRSLR